MTQNNLLETQTSAQIFEDVIRKPTVGVLKLYISRIPQRRIFQTMVDEGKILLSRNFNVIVAEDEQRRPVDFPPERIIACQKMTIASESIYEMNYDTILNLSPDIVIVNDITHVNIATSIKKMRYENVRFFLQNGINVIASAYGSWDNTFDDMIRFAGRNFPVSSQQWQNLPLNETVALVFTSNSSFHHAELSSGIGE